MRMLAGYASGVVALCELDVSSGTVDYQPLTGHHRDGSGAGQLLSHTAAVAAAPGQEGCVCQRRQLAICDEIHVGVYFVI